jgi:hypothetical protein
MSVLRFCKSWFWQERMTNNPITESEARKRHAEREEYTVAIGGFEKPNAMVEVVNRMVAVTFFDTLLRREFDYTFQEKEPNRLFLSMAVRRQYCPATPAMITRMEAGRKNPDQPWGQFLADVDHVLDGRAVIFKENGTTFHSAGRHGDARQVRQPGPSWDVSKHWEPYPEFDDYEYLLRRDREIPWGPGLDGP